MYYVYVDEAGTSANEPVSVVVGILIHADRDWIRAKNAVESAFSDHVPSHFRDGFIFHAKSVWSDPKYRDRWPMEKRIELIGAMAAIPRLLGSAIAIGKVRRDWKFPHVPNGMTLSQFQHTQAFGRAIQRADQFVKDRGAPGEIATVVAEDVPKMRKFLKASVQVFRKNPISVPLTPEFLRPTLLENKLGGKIIFQKNLEAISRVVDTVHFVEKDEAPILQIADACAFVLRRYLTKGEFGERWIRDMRDRDLVWDDWQGPISHGIFDFGPAKIVPFRMDF